tara:strand:- start:2116 stop:2604 length:489 start_codon:yes stop_codon:yes gene_type:complete
MGASKGKPLSLGGSGGSGVFKNIIKRVAGGPLGLGKAVLGGAAGATASALGSAAGGSSISSDRPFSREAQTQNKNMEEKQEIKKNIEGEKKFDFDSVKERLLKRAKERRSFMTGQLMREKEIYDSSLPKGDKASELLLGDNFKGIANAVSKMPLPIKSMYRG